MKRFLNFVDTKILGGNRFWVTLGLIGVFYSLSILLKTGYLADDTYNSQIRGSLMHENLGVIERTWLEIMGWIKGAGRFYPLAFYPYILFYFIQSLILYKIISIFVVIASAFALYYLVKLVFKNELLARSLLFIFPLFLQFRAWHDPLLGFHFLIPLVFLWILLSLINFQKFLDTTYAKYNYISIAFFIIACSTYEISYLFFLTFLALAYFKTSSFKPSLRLAKGQTIVFLTFVILGLVLKSKLNPYFTNTYPGATVNLDLHNIKRTFWIQVTAAFPLLYQKMTNLALRPREPADVLFVLSVVFIFFRFVKQKIIFEYKNALILGLLFLTVPAIPLALSGGYQQQLMDLGIGHGYIPVYIQYGGFTLVFLACFFWVNSKIVKQGLKISFHIFVAIFIFLVGVTHLTQNKTVAYSTFATKHPRQVLGDAIESALFSTVPAGATILTNPRFSHDWLWFYSSHAGKKIYMFSAEDFIQASPPATVVDVNLTSESNSFCKPLDPIQPTQSKLGTHKWRDTSNENIYAMTYFFDPTEGSYGSAYFSKVSGILFDIATKQVSDIKTQKIYLYDYISQQISEFQAQPNQDFNFKKIFDEVNEKPSQKDGFQEQLNACVH